MAHYVQLPQDVWTMLQCEAEASGRSVQNQALHWIQIGKAIERSNRFSNTCISRTPEQNHISNKETEQ